MCTGAAQKAVRRHYQWIVVNQFLAATLDTDVFEDVRDNGPTVFVGSMTDKIPREFQVAAYRFGHSQIRPGYNAEVKDGLAAPWVPTLPQRSGIVTGEFTMTDLLTLAGVA